MSRDHEQLKVFAMADALAVAMYLATRGFPVAERFGLQSQLRRAAVSIPTNIVEGCARRTHREYLHFVSIATASASEVRYLVGLAGRLGYLHETDELITRYSDLIRALQGLINFLESQGPILESEV